MAIAPIETVIEYLRPVLVHDGAGRTDAQLLESFIDQKDEVAFAALVRRHGAMVLSVCRRVVRNLQDAEDAFQATFFVLARKGASVRPREMVANWLHGVAYRTSLKARTMSAKRRMREKQMVEMPDVEAPRQEHQGDVLPLLDEELDRLPAQYRLPIVLCVLEGKTIKAASRQLGWPQGTLAGRLARGRKILAKRLTRRGVALSGASLVMPHPETIAFAGIPTSLMISTIKAAMLIQTGQTTVAVLVPAKVVVLMQGVIKAMFLTKLKTLAAGLLALSIVAFGGGMIAIHNASGQQNSPNAANQPPTADERANQNPKIDPKPGTDGDSKTEIAALRTEISKLRIELESAVKEINGLKDALRKAAPPKDQVTLYRGKPKAFWLEQLKDADPKFRVDAVYALGVLVQKSNELIPELIVALMDKNDEVGVAASWAVANMGPPTIPLLLNVLKDKTSQEGFRNAADAVVIMKDKAKAAIPVLTETLKVENMFYRYQSVSVFKRLGKAAKSAIPAMVEALGTSLDRVGNKNVDVIVRLNEAFFQAFVIEAVLAIDPDVKAILPIELLPPKAVGPDSNLTPGSKDSIEHAALRQRAYAALKKKYEKGK